MKLIYLSSPYRNSKGEFFVLNNICYAHKIARYIWELGAVCFSPCSNTAFMGGEDFNDDKFIEGDLEILKRCDALYLNKGWENSEGCKKEKKFAEKINLPIFDDLFRLETWLKLEK